MNEEVRKLVEFVAEDLYREQVPFGDHVVSVESMLDAIAEIWQINKGEIGAVFNPIRQRLESR